MLQIVYKMKKQQMKKQLIVFMMCLATFALSAQELSTSNSIIAPALLKDDLEVLKTNWEQLHGAFYLYSSKEEIDTKFEEIASKIGEGMTSIEFYRLTAPLLKLIGNGHTHIVPSKLFYQSMRKEMKYFPIDLYLDKGQVYVLKNNSDTEEVKQGDIVKSINGQEAIVLIKSIADGLTRDGVNETWPMTRATKRFSEFYIFNFGDSEKYEIEIEDLNGNTTRYSLVGKTKTEVDSMRIEKYGDTKNWVELKDPAYTLEIEGRTAIMTLRTFSQKEIKKYNKVRSKKWFEDAFTQINQAGVESLIIDMRGNGGGDEEPTIELFSHLHDKEFQFYKDVYLEERKIPNGKLYEDNIFLLNIYAKLVTKKKDDKFILKSKGLKSYPPAKEQFGGKVIVLTDAASFSATGEMTAILKEHDRAIFVGEEAGGNPNQNTSGAMLILNLPHSGLRAIVPVVVYEMNVTFPNTGLGVIPDYELKNSINDEINGVDGVMKFAKRLAVER